MTQIKESFIKHLEEVIPGFERELRKNEVAQLLWMLIEPSHRHMRYDHSININSRELNRIFGKSPNFEDINRMRRYFWVHPPQSNAGRESFNSGYEPAPWLKVAFDTYLNSEFKISPLLDGLGRKIAKPRRAIDSLTKAGNPMVGWKGVNVPNLININTQNLFEIERYFRDRYEASSLGIFLANGLADDITSEGYSKRIHCSAGLRDLAANNSFPGQISQRYVQAQSGRLYAEGINLQNCPKEVRAAALAGHWDYDIDCCHFAILSQMANKFGMECSAINFYIANKQFFRESIANEALITPTQAKTVLISTIYGAIESKRSIDAIPAEIGIKASGRLYKSESYRRIKDEVKKAFKLILKEHPISRGFYINQFNMAIPVNSKGSSIIAHLLQGVEASALRSSAIAADNDLILLQHDGFTTSKPIDKEYVEQQIFIDTGYKLSIESKQLTMPNPEYKTEKWYLDLKTKCNRKPNKNKGLRMIFTSFGYTLAPEHWDIPSVFPDKWDFETPF